MANLPQSKRRPSRIGIGLLPVIFGIIGLVTLFKPSPGMMRPDNPDQFVGMLLAPLLFGMAGILIIISGFRRL